MKLEILHCFCSAKPNFGNPAGVVKDFAGSEEEKQKTRLEIKPAGNRFHTDS